MNSSSAAVLFLFFLFSANPFSLSATAAKEPVLDTDGEELRSGVQYIIRSAIWGAGDGALNFGSDFECPRFVVQDRLRNGMPVLFYPVDSNDTTVYQSSDVNIMFTGGDAYCRSLINTWRVAPYDPSSGHWWLRTNGEIGNPGPQTLFSWFKIEKVKLGYKLTFCPSVCESCVTLCNDIGRYSYQNKIVLGLTNGYAWPFVFVKAPQAIKQVVEKHPE
ncbi:ARABIDOPSIS THALIANA KUNITZ TRYPSIN INHIBITOR 5 [Hibiscus trionum]|uniref:ARABIDOPSIS THALIANA KUNITZ TRYPSIN INHIBITOR 5 n=1 Tax=Hibiscus trionum TaxID=183268 RepID=A0A9W7J4B0_HIBTR|nr:ARABIDOPSIS THALIANA KUNITZ TRYPSIN INHIBITOR 5 [Hibiscus trionum]